MGTFCFFNPLNSHDCMSIYVVLSNVKSGQYTHSIQILILAKFMNK